MDGTLEILHTSGMKTVHIISDALRKARVTRLADPWTMKLDSKKHPQTGSSAVISTLRGVVAQCRVGLL